MNLVLKKQKRDIKVQKRITSNDQKTSENFIKRKDDSEISKTIPIPEKIIKPLDSSSEELTVMKVLLMIAH